MASASRVADTDPGMGNTHLMALNRRFSFIAALVVGGAGLACSGSGEPAPSVCPPRATTELVAPKQAAVARTVYVFLVDRAFSPNGKQSTSYPWPQLPTTALQAVSALIPKLDLRPSDVVFGAWISHNSNDLGEIFLPLAQVPSDSPLVLDASPSPVPTPLNKLGCNEYALRLATYETAANKWQASADDQQAKLTAARQAAVNAFAATARSRVSAAIPQQDTLGTDIYGALAVAAGVFKVNPGTRKLVIFSDMSDTVQKSVQPDLSGADVIIALYHRDDVADQAQAQVFWRTALQKLGTHVPTFVDWAATTPDKIVQLLGGQR